MLSEKDVLKVKANPTFSLDQNKRMIPTTKQRIAAVVIPLQDPLLADLLLDIQVTTKPFNAEKLNIQMSLKFPAISRPLLPIPYLTDLTTLWSFQLATAQAMRLRENYPRKLKNQLNPKLESKRKRKNVPP